LRHRNGSLQTLDHTVWQRHRWLEASTEGRFIHFPFLKDRAPILDNLRAEPEFAELMERVRKKWEKFKAELGVE
jgi:hypothetical protein